MNVRELADDAVVVLVSDLHIGGSGGDEIFASATELTDFLHSLYEIEGPVDLVILGDFLDIERLGPPGAAVQGITATLARPDYADLFEAFRRFRSYEGRRIVYVVGNHDAESWWNRDVQLLLQSAGVVDEVALSYAAEYGSLPQRLIYGEHGNQFDASNRITDYNDPLDKPLGDYVVSEVVRPIGASAKVSKSLDLGEVNYVFPLRSVPEWVIGRIFYRFFTEMAYWLLIPLVVVNVLNVALSALFARDAGLRAIQWFFTQVTYGVLLLLLVMVVVFLIARRTAGRTAASLTPRFGIRKTEPELIRELLESRRNPPHGPGLDAADIAVWVSGHSHSPSMSALDRPDGNRIAVVNTGCWLRQLHPFKARLGAPRVYVPVFVQSHVRVSRVQQGLEVELWNRPKPADRRLSWLERAALVGRAPAPITSTAPVLVSREVV